MDITIKPLKHAKVDENKYLLLFSNDWYDSVHYIVDGLPDEISWEYFPPKSESPYTIYATKRPKNGLWELYIYSDNYSRKCKNLSYTEMRKIFTEAKEIILNDN